MSSKTKAAEASGLPTTATYRGSADDSEHRSTVVFGREFPAGVSISVSDLSKKARRKLAANIMFDTDADVPGKFDPAVPGEDDDED